MFNISEHTIVTGAENVRSIKHLNACLHEKGKHEKPCFSFFGTHVAKGTVLVHTADGDVLVTFDEKDGWARSIAIEKVEA